MHAAIEYKELLKVIDPTKDEFDYEGSALTIDLKQLKKYVESPDAHKLFEATDDKCVNLYKNLALYIINHKAKEPAIISIDLDSSPPIKEGLFEYVNGLYAGQKKAYISIAETGDNLLLIKSRKLTELPHQEIAHLQEAKDTKLVNLSSVFASAPVQGEQFLWQAQGEDLYAKQDFLLTKVKELIENPSYKHKDKDFERLFAMADKSVINSEEFIKDLFSLQNPVLTKALVNGDLLELIAIDFNADFFKGYLSQSVQEGKMLLLSKLYEAKYHYNPKEHLADLDLTPYINLPASIAYLTKTTLKSSSYSEEFALISCYRHFYPEHKEDKAIIFSYLEALKNNTGSHREYVDSAKAFEIPLHLFNDKEILSKFVKVLDIKDFSQELKQRQLSNTVLTDSCFLLEHASRLPIEQIDKIVNYFYQQSQVTKELVSSIIDKNYLFYEKVKTFAKPSKSDERHVAYGNLYKDMDIIMQAHKGGLACSCIPMDAMKNHLLKTGEDEYWEAFKLNYLIRSGNIHRLPSDFYSSASDIETFDAKYRKPAYLFFSIERPSWDNGRQKVLSKYRKTEEVLAVLQEIEHLNMFNYFDGNTFHAHLYAPLRKNPQIVERILELGPLSYGNLDEQMKYNTQVVLKILRKDESTIHAIPREFFNDINFCLEFTKLLDEGKYSLKTVPEFIARFFENQGVTQNYHDYLKAYTSFHKIGATLASATPGKSPKRKI